MTVAEISPSGYVALYRPHFSVYDSPAFIELNAPKVEAVRYLALTESDSSPLVAQAFGLRNGRFRAPFSAPFSAPLLAPEASPDHLKHFYRQLPDVLGAEVSLTLPAQCYPPVFVPDGLRTDDFNYHYPLERVADFESHLSRSGRYSHRRALRHPFEFVPTDDISRAYEVIRINREAMGYPLAMTLDQVKATAPITHGRFFILSLMGRDVAAAVVFQPVPSVAQVIYWGDIPEARPYRAMNSLPWHLFRWYADNCPDIKIIDIGPSSTDGIINRGLAAYKLSIGCIETLKPSVILPAPVSL